MNPSYICILPLSVKKRYLKKGASLIFLKTLIMKKTLSLGGETKKVPEVHATQNTCTFFIKIVHLKKSVSLIFLKNTYPEKKTQPWGERKKCLKCMPLKIDAPFLSKPSI